ncbi:PREDICTED: ermin [Chaetura pelagica]|uniref:ermin n=1 Tax=Chaetura pelagica TaxID=8897 RepID=UPI0005235142|nr:PREDICTED: ermin [Chaetura pelagica]
MSLDKLKKGLKKAQTSDVSLKFQVLFPKDSSDRDFLCSRSRRKRLVTELVHEVLAWESNIPLLLLALTEAAPAAPAVPECNGSVAPEKGPRQVVGAVDEIADSVGTVPYGNAETGPDRPLGKGNQEENGDSLTEDAARGDLDGGKQREEKQEESHGMLQQGSADTQDTGTSSQESEGGLGRAAHGQAEPGAAQEEAEEEEEEEEEEDTEEDEVQVIEMKKENGAASPPRQQDSSKDVASAPTSPGCNAQAEKPGEQPSLGKKNDISRHSYSRYNTISYRRIRKGNTKQRIDEFESMMHL